MQTGSLEHFGTLFNPTVLILNIPTPTEEVQIEEADYIEVESKLSVQESIELDENGIYVLREKLDGKVAGIYEISDFQYQYGEYDLEIFGKVNLKVDGSIEWHELTAITENNESIPVTFAKEYFNNLLKFLHTK